MSETDDADLVRRAQAGESDAVGELYDRHHIRIFRYLMVLVRDRHLAEDMTGEVFARMVSRLATFRLIGVPFQAWLYRIAHNLAMDHLRRPQQMAVLPDQEIESLPSSPAADGLAVWYERQQSMARIRAALDALDEMQQQVIILRFVAGLSLQETARALGKSVPAIKSIQHRGLTALRRALEQET